MVITLSLIDLALDVPVGEGLELAQAGGFKALDLASPDCTGRPIHSILGEVEQASTEEIISKFDGAGIRPGAWWLPVEFRYDEATYRTDLRALPRWAEVTQQLQSHCCITWLWPYSDTLDYKANLAQHVARLRPIGQILGEHGCELGLEFIGPVTMRTGHQYEFIHTMDGIMALIDRLDLDNVGLLLDSWQWHTSGGTIGDLAKLAPGQVSYIHLADAPLGRELNQQLDEERELPGQTGVVDVVGFLKQMDRIGFEGLVSVEPYNAQLNASPPFDRVRIASKSLTTMLQLAGIRV